MQIRTLQIPWTTIGIDATTEVWVPCTNWVQSDGVENARMNWELEAMTAEFNARPALQFANTPDGTKTTIALETTFQTTAGLKWATGWKAVSTESANNMICRGGFFVKKTNSGLTFGRVTGQLELKGC